MEENENIGYLVIVLIGFGMLLLAFIISYVNLSRFRNCYDNNFKYKYCVNYKNY